MNDPRFYAVFKLLFPNEHSLRKNLNLDSHATRLETEGWMIEAKCIKSLSFWRQMTFDWCPCKSRFCPCSVKLSQVDGEGRKREKRCTNSRRFAVFGGPTKVILSDRQLALAVKIRAEKWTQSVTHSLSLSTSVTHSLTKSVVTRYVCIIYLQCVVSNFSGVIPCVSLDSICQAGIFFPRIAANDVHGEWQTSLLDKDHFLTETCLVSQTGWRVPWTE